MRMLVLTNLYPPHHMGGYEMRCAEAVAGLRDRGHEVRVLSSVYKTGPAAEPPIERRLHFHGGPPYPPEDAEGFIRAELADVCEVRQAIEQFRPDLVSVWGMEFCSHNVPAAASRAPVPCVFQIEDVWLRDGAQRDLWMNLLRALPDPAGWRQVCPALASLLLPAMDRLALPADVTVLFASEALRVHYVRGGWDHPHVAVYRGGIDVDRYFAPVRSERPGGPVRLLYVGQVTRERGIEDLLAAIRMLAGRPDGAPIECKVCGPVAEVFRGELDRAIASLPPRACVQLAGPQDPERLRSAYREAHVLVHPSRLREGLPRVIQEALSAGLVVVATDTGGQRDLLGRNEYGYLCRPGEPEGLAATLEAILNDWPKAVAKAAAGQEFVRREFSTQRMVQRLEQFAFETIARVESAGRDRDRPQRWQATVRRAGAEIPRFCTFLRQTLQEQIMPQVDALPPESLWRTGSLAKRLGLLDAAERLLERLRELAGGQTDHVRRCEFHLAELWMIRADWRRAGEHLERCLAVAPEHAKAVYYLRHVADRSMPPNLDRLARALRS